MLPEISRWRDAERLRSFSMFVNFSHSSYLITHLLTQNATSSCSNTYALTFFHHLSSSVAILIFHKTIWTTEAYIYILYCYTFWDEALSNTLFLPCLSTYSTLLESNRLGGAVIAYFLCTFYFILSGWWYVDSSLHINSDTMCCMLILEFFLCPEFHDRHHEPTPREQQLLRCLFSGKFGI